MANFVAEDEAGRLRASYGEEKYPRLAELKRRWDPDNLFRLNQNIPAQGGNRARPRPSTGPHAPG